MKITTRKDEVQLLIEQVEKLNAIVEHQAQAIIDLMNQQEHIISWSRGATKLINETALNVKAIETTLIKELTK